MKILSILGPTGSEITTASKQTQNIQILETVEMPKMSFDPLQLAPGRAFGSRLLSRIKVVDEPILSYLYEKAKKMQQIRAEKRVYNHYRCEGPTDSRILAEYFNGEVSSMDEVLCAAFYLIDISECSIMEILQKYGQENLDLGVVQIDGTGEAYCNVHIEFKMEGGALKEIHIHTVPVSRNFKDGRQGLSLEE